MTGEYPMLIYQPKAVAVPAFRLLMPAQSRACRAAPVYSQCCSVNLTKLAICGNCHSHTLSIRNGPYQTNSTQVYWWQGAS